MSPVVGFCQRGESPLHRLHPLSKALVVVAICILAFALGGHRTWLLVGAVAAASGLAGTHWASLRGLVAFGLPLAAAVIVIQLVGPPEGTTTWQWGPLTLTAQKLLSTSGLVARLLVLVGAFQLFATTTHPDDLFAAIVQLRLPRGVAYATVGGLLFLPHLRDRIAAVREAQQARGVKLGGGPINRAKSVGPLVRPVLLSALTEALDRELALVARGFELPGRTTSIRALRMNNVDRVVGVLASVIATIGMLWLLLE